MEKRYDIRKQPLRYMWCEILKISGEDAFRFVSIVAVVCTGWLALEKHIDTELITWVKKWIDPIERTYAIIALYTIAGIGIITYIYNYAKKNAHLRFNGWAFWTLLTIIYSYYRFYSDSPFEFWKIGEYVAWMDIIYLIDVMFLILMILYVCRIYTFEESEASKYSDLIRDDAIENDDDDKLGYDTIADELKERIDTVDLSRKAFSMGIVGGWGLGKSSLLNLFAKQQEEAEQIVVRFNPRSAKKADLIQEEFFSVFTHELSKYSFNAHYIIGKYAYALNLHSSTKWIYAIIDLFEKWTSETQKQRINDLIHTTGKKIFVIIEDLDRLTGPEIIEVLKLIDANGNFCNTVFLTAYDKNYVNGVLRKQIGFEDSVTNFTDKYFHYELHLFKHISYPIHRFLDRYLLDWAQKEWDEDEYVQQQIAKEWPMVCGHLLSQLTTMRHAKRYVNLFRSSYLKIKEHVDFGDYTIVTLIRYLDVESYYALYAKRYIQHPGKIFDQKESWVLKDGYEKLAAESRISNFSKLLEYLFNGVVRQFESRYNKINRTESFDNYFYDKIDGVLYYEDLNRMMNAESLGEGLEIIMACKGTDSKKQSAIEFLCMQDAAWVRTEERLVRYLKMLIYANEQIGGYEIQQQLIGMLLNETQERYEEIVDKKGYLDCIKKAFNEMLPIVPLSIGQFIKFRLNARYGDAGDWQEKLLESIEYDHIVLKQAQQKYDELIEKGDWSARNAISLGTPVKNEPETYAKVRARYLKKMMNQHPDEYAEAMIWIETSDYDKTYTIVKISPYDDLKAAIGDDVLLKWSKKIKDADKRFIVQYLLKNKKESGYPNERIEIYTPNADRNYALIAKTLKENKE